MSTKVRWLASSAAAACVTWAAVAIWNGSTTLRPSYAAENAAQSATAQLGRATDLSNAFQVVAQTMRPSVVSIGAVKHARPRVDRRRPGQQQPGLQQLPPGLPEELRRFFGNDLGERFWQPAPDMFPEQSGLGSGVIVSEDGFVLTNNHVIDGADEVKVTLYDERTIPAKVVGADAKTDVAVLKIEARNLVPAKLGNSDDLKVGEWVVAIGSPFGLDQTVTAGIISGKGRVTGIIGRDGYEDFLQTDAAINPGNSGGPLVNLHGEVIGINTAIASRGGVAGNVGVGFAIPSNMANNIMQSIISTGKVVRGWLGAAIQPLDEGLADSFGFRNQRGVLIGSVVPDSPAAKAGLREGDIVTELNGRAVETTSQLRNNIAAVKPNTKANLTVFRDGKSQAIAVTIGELVSEATGGSEPDVRESTGELGVRVESLTPQLAEQIGHKGDLQGVVVVEVSPDSVAARSLEPGDVIVAVGGKSISNMNDYRETIGHVDLKKGVRMQVLREGVKRFIFLRESP